MVNFLSKKFDIESESSYIIKQIDTKYLEIAHMEARCQCFVAIKGSSPLKSLFSHLKRQPCMQHHNCASAQNVWIAVNYVEGTGLVPI